MNIATNNFYNNKVNNVSFQAKIIPYDALIECINKGMSNTEIGKMLGVPYRDVYTSVKKAGLKSADRIAKEKRNANILDLYKQGLSISQIARRLNLKDNVVSRFCKTNSLPTRKDKRYLAEIPDDKLRSIAEKMNLSKDFLDKNLK